ncbi:MAG: UDP-N-acetylmuramate dehydrogenase [Bacillota bacterium]|nr:UDP-N-acetylmuramate dehydrogenase [Bacillota bacterium]
MEKSILKDLEASNACFKIAVDEPMSNHTTFKIGGPASILVTPLGMYGLADVVTLCRQKSVPYLVIGNGSNLLVSDSGLDMVVIKTTEGLGEVRVDRDRQLVSSESGASLARLAVAAKEAALSGIEYLYGIPGSVGGAVFMNAGAYGGETADVLVKTEYLDADGDVKELRHDQHDFAYRHSVFMDNGNIILRSWFQLETGDTSMIRGRMEEMMQSRRDKQPLEFPSAGSVFKRPEGFFTGRLIEDSGLKGFSIGGAQVSEKHAGFIINKGGATCDDVRRLVNHIQETVFKNFNVKLECEIKYIG